MNNTGKAMLRQLILYVRKNVPSNLRDEWTELTNGWHNSPIDLEYVSQAAELMNRLMAFTYLDADGTIVHPASFEAVAVEQPTDLRYAKRSIVKFLGWLLHRADDWQHKQWNGAEMVRLLHFFLDNAARLNRVTDLWAQWLKLRDQYEFELVSGAQLVQAYATGPQSCMKGKASKLSLYKTNPDKVQLLKIKYQGKYIGRALLWQLDNGQQYLDRIYPSDGGAHIAAALNWANEQAIVVSNRNGVGLARDIDLRVTLRHSANGRMPYLDSFNTILIPKVSGIDNPYLTASHITLFTTAAANKTQLEDAIANGKPEFTEDDIRLRHVLRVRLSNFTVRGVGSQGGGIDDVYYNSGRRAARQHLLTGRAIPGLISAVPVYTTLGRIRWLPLEELTPEVVVKVYGTYFDKTMFVTLRDGRFVFRKHARKYKDHYLPKKGVEIVAHEPFSTDLRGIIDYKAVNA